MERIILHLDKQETLNAYANGICNKVARSTPGNAWSCTTTAFLFPPDLTDITLDPMTAHKRIVLSDGYTKASVSDQHLNYPDSPERFSVCSQVLGSEGFCKGRFYWEVQLSSSTFVGIGLAYSNMDRKGPTSRLGRNAQSWCVEWFNIKLSAWHNSTETVLANPVPKCVGVLLDCDNGTATFYSVADKAYPFHSFVFPFHGALYPAFWIFSSGSSISLRTVKAWCADANIGTHGNSSAQSYWWWFYKICNSLLPVSGNIYYFFPLWFPF